MGVLNQTLHSEGLLILRCAQLLIAIIILGLSASTASDWVSVDCNVPSGTAWNVACVSLNLLLRVLLSGGHGSRKTHTNLSYAHRRCLLFLLLPTFS
jgi:hypothetical protein